LVARAFLGPCPEGMEVNHKDTNKSNYRLDNVEYLTSQGNKQHAVLAGVWPTGDRHGSRKHPETRPRGERHANAKLTDAIIREIRCSTETCCALAKRFSVTDVLVSLIKRRKAWVHVE
jgi:hypothetical protein